MSRRFALLAALAVTVLSCAKSDATTAPEATTGTVYWKLDAATCRPPAPVAFDFFVDGSQVGTGTLSLASPTSQGYSVTAGQHILTTRVSNTTANWTPATVTVAGGGSFTYLILCG